MAHDLGNRIVEIILIVSLEETHIIISHNHMISRTNNHPQPAYQHKVRTWERTLTSTISS